MAETPESDIPDEETRRPPATTIDGRENQLISLAVDLAEQQLADGTASAQVISHFLKMGSTREQLEQKRLEHDIELMKAKKEGMVAAERIEGLYAAAIDAMRRYSGHEPEPEDDEEDYDD